MVMSSSLNEKADTVLSGMTTVKWMKNLQRARQKNSVGGPDRLCPLPHSHRGPSFKESY